MKQILNTLDILKYLLWGSVIFILLNTFTRGWNYERTPDVLNFYNKIFTTTDFKDFFYKEKVEYIHILPQDSKPVFSLYIKRGIFCLARLIHER